MKKRLLLAATALLLAACFLTGCSLVGVNEDKARELAVAKVNGTTIKKGDYDDYVSYYLSMYGIDSSDTSNEELVSSIKTSVLEMLIEEQLVLQQADEEGLTRDNEEIKKKAEETVATQKENLLSYATAQAESEKESDDSIDVDKRAQEILDEYYENQGLTEEILLQQACDSARYDMMYEKTIGDQTPDDAAIEQKYKSLQAEQKTQFTETPSDFVSATGPIAWNPAGYRYVKHILIAFDEEIQDELAELEQSEEEADQEKWSTRSQEEAKKLQSKVDEILKKLDGGESFDDLIQEYSDDTNGKADEDIVKNGMLAGDGVNLVEPFLKGAMALKKVGDVSDPVVSSYGVHLIQYFSDLKEGAVPLADIKQEISDTLKEENETAAWTEAIEAWKEKAEIKKYENRM